MTHARLLAAAFLLSTISGCAGSAPRGGSPLRRTASYGSADSGGGATASAEAAPSSYGSATSDRAPTERPGLGTVWGENVSSHVETKPFERRSSSPFASVALFYNDADGVRAQTRYLGGFTLHPLRAFTPHRGVSVGLVAPNGLLLTGGAVNGRTLVVGDAGARYNIVLENSTGGRYEIVASVDGLDVIDGRLADLAKRGYILEPYSSLAIDGFRRSNNTVAAFRFGRVADSYAARTSGDRNVGVVGIALFSERGSQWSTDELHRRDQANPFPGDRAYSRPPTY